MVTAVRLQAPSDRLLDPAAADWVSVPEETVTLGPTPIGSQPTEYVIAAWTDRPFGLVQRARVAAAHNGEALFVRMRWEDGTRDDGSGDIDRFADAAAVLFPVGADAPLLAMGAPTQPVNAWYWRADQEEPLSVTATGLGTTVRGKNGSVSAAAVYGAGAWSVVLSRPFRVADKNAAGLWPGRSKKIAFAVWQGSNGERAGIKSASLEWQTLEVER